jgi:hypothetical protein
VGLLRKCAAAWASQSASVAPPPTASKGAPAHQATEAAVNAATIYHMLAALLTSSGDAAGAAEAFTTIASEEVLPHAPAEYRAIGLACLSMLQSQLAATASAAAAPELLRESDMKLRRATALAVGLGGRKPSFADLSRATEAAEDELEWGAAPLTSVSSSSSSSSSSASVGTSSSSGKAASNVSSASASASPVVMKSYSVGGPLAKAAASAATPETDAAQSALSAEEALAKARKERHLEAARRAARARRARARVAFLAALREKGLYDVPGIPNSKPDPERWLPKRLRTGGTKAGRRAVKKAGNNLSSGSAQGAVSEAVANSLDARARAEAASKGAASSTTSASSAAASKKKKK